jgi:hypothetical protein
VSVFPVPDGAPAQERAQKPHANQVIISSQRLHSVSALALQSAWPEDYEPALMQELQEVT